MYLSIGVAAACTWIGTPIGRFCANVLIEGGHAQRRACFRRERSKWSTDHRSIFDSSLRYQPNAKTGTTIDIVNEGGRALVPGTEDLQIALEIGEDLIAARMTQRGKSSTPIEPAGCELDAKPNFHQLVTNERVFQGP